MDEPDILCGMVSELRAAVELPIFVKMRVFVDVAPTVTLAKKLAVGFSWLSLPHPNFSHAMMYVKSFRAKSLLIV